MPLINPEYRPSKINRPIVLSPACNHPHNKFFSKNNGGAGWMLIFIACYKRIGEVPPTITTQNLMDKFLQKK